MSKTPLRKSPLQLPVNTAEFLRTFVYDRAPTSSDYKNFKISDLWIHRNPSGTPPYGYFVLVDRPNGTGVWLDIGGKTSGDIQTLTGDTGGIIEPDANGNVDVLGGSNINTAGTTNTLTVNLNDDIEVNSISFDSGTNKLGDYIDATSWVPVVKFGGNDTGITYLDRGGGYSRIGNVVWFSWDFNFTSKGSATGDATISGLPFTSNGSYSNPIGRGGAITLTANYNNPYTFTSTSDVLTLSQTSITGLSNIAMTDVNFANGSGMGGTGFFFV